MELTRELYVRGEIFSRFIPLVIICLIASFLFKKLKDIAFVPGYEFFFSLIHDSQEGIKDNNKKVDEINRNRKFKSEAGFRKHKANEFKKSSNFIER